MSCIRLVCIGLIVCGLALPLSAAERQPAGELKPVPSLESLDLWNDPRWQRPVSCSEARDLAQAAAHLGAVIELSMEAPDRFSSTAPAFKPPVEQLPAWQYLELLAWYYELSWYVSDGRVDLDDRRIVGRCGLFAEASLTRLPRVFWGDDNDALHDILQVCLAQDPRADIGHFGLQVAVQKDLLHIVGYQHHYRLLREFFMVVSGPAALVDGDVVWPATRLSNEAVAEQVAVWPDWDWRVRAANVLAQPAGKVYNTDAKGRESRSLQVPTAAAAEALWQAADMGILVHPRLREGSCSSTSSGLHQTVGSGLQMFAGSAGGQVVLRHGLILIEPAAERPSSSSGDNRQLYAYQRPVLPRGWTMDDLEAMIQKSQHGDASKPAPIICSLPDRLLVLQDRDQAGYTSGIIHQLLRHFGDEHLD